MRIRKSHSILQMTIWMLAGILSEIIACRSQQMGASPFFAEALINLDHLNYLCERVAFDDDTVTIVHIYSEHPDYEWVDAEGEGIACVDDVARAAVVYSRYFEMTGDETVLPRIKELLHFVVKMQAEDGEFYNFVYPDMRINRNGRTSKKSFNFWAARGYWALGHGYRVFYSRDPEYGRWLKTHFLKCKGPLRKLIGQYGSMRKVGGRDYPVWLVNGSGSDATSELLLGLNAYLMCDEDQELTSMTSKLIDGILKMQVGKEHAHPGAFLSWPGVWHAYANAQTVALTVLSKTLNRPEWIAAAEIEANHFYGWMVKNHFLSSFSLLDKSGERIFPQIAYNYRPVVVGLLRLYEVTKNPDYAEWAGLSAAWFFGRNPAERSMFDVQNGRCYDGINDSTRINFNSGAESTIEALLSLLEVARNQTAYEKLRWWQTHAQADEGERFP